jgi:hypothetical protein
VRVEPGARLLHRVAVLDPVDRDGARLRHGSHSHSIIPGYGNALNLQRKFFLGTIRDRAPVANLWRPIFHRMHERRLTLTEMARAVTDNPRDFANCKRELQEMRWFVADIDHMLRLTGASFPPWT